jgi:cyclopropane fatty-acyl-phospholipid synthase-like methyltransferase
MPWFSLELDPDLKEELKKREIHSGTFLDIGTGPATQAIQLAYLGFEVIGTDLSAAAVEKAQQLYTQGIDTWLDIPEDHTGSAQFYVDDILKSEISKKISKKFNYAFDRGCFHVLPPEERKTYVQAVKDLLASDGILFLKCFSTDQGESHLGPYRFASADLKAVFESDFELLSVKKTIYQGTLEEKPKALFAVLRKK